jgi:hypothetical protein
MKIYERMTTDDFDRCLAEVINNDNDNPSALLSIAGIYEVLSEHYNNAVLDEWLDNRRVQADTRDLTLCETCGAFIDPALGDEDPDDPGRLHFERDGSLDEPRAPSNDDNDCCAVCAHAS